MEDHSIAWLITLPGEIYSDTVSRYVFNLIHQDAALLPTLWGAYSLLYVLIPRPLFGRAIYNYWNILDLASRLDWWTGTKIIQMWSNETPLVRSCVETPQSSFCMVLKQITPTEGFVVLTTEQLATLVAGDNGYEKLVLATWAQITSYNWQPS